MAPTVGNSLSGINAGNGSSFWQQIVNSIGWLPDYSTVRKGKRFVIRPGAVTADVYQLYKTHAAAAAVDTLEELSSPRILLVTATIPVPTDASSTSSTAKLADYALGEIQAVQEALAGLVVLAKQDE